jgi:sugar O-acyltransferase (sialic acid O-acetyltransferase NeuD family)
MTKLLIIGASGHGRVAADCAEAMNCYSEICFADAIYPEQQQNLHWPVVGDDDFWRKHINDYHFIVAIGNNEIRAKFINEVIRLGGKLATLVHPSASISQYAEVGIGSVVFANAVVNVGCKLGIGSIINTGATVDHDCIINDFCHIAPGVHISGAVIIGERCWIGVGSTIIQLLNIGNNVTVGAGSTVIKDLAPNATYVGSPARKLIK